jgi:hypothetical protein
VYFSRLGRSSPDGRKGEEKSEKAEKFLENERAKDLKKWCHPSKTRVF